MALLPDLMSGKLNPNYQAPKPKTQASTQTVTNKPVPVSGPRGVYWIGEDGNVYVKENANPNNVKNYGESGQLGYKSFDALNGLSEIDDPVVAERKAAEAAAAAAAAGAPKQTGTGKTIPDRSASIAMQLAGLAEVDPYYNQTLGSINSSLDSLKGRYGEDAARAEGNFTEQSTTNRQNLLKNKQTALVNAAQGRRGLFGTLSSIGALNGSGIDLANRAVAAGANADLAGAGDTFEENQTNLVSSIEGFRADDTRRREDADKAAADARIAAKNAAATSKQKYLTQLANDYYDMEQKGKGQSYADQAAGLFKEIAATGAPTSLDYRTAAYTPSTLANYLAGAQNTNVQTTPATPGGLPGLVATPRKRRQAVTV